MAGEIDGEDGEEGAEEATDEAPWMRSGKGWRLRSS